MSWFFKHKLLLLLIIAAMWYWFKNPPDRFGISMPGFVVYNKIPVFFLDCYIDPSGKLHLEADLSKEVNINYWIENHLTVHDSTGAVAPVLFVGTGFAGKPAFTFTPDQLQDLHHKNIQMELMPSAAAIERLNAARQNGIPAGILLKIK